MDYVHTDVLGSVRATTDQSGATLARHDYFAFGEDAGPGPATGPERQRFTGKERDSETFFGYFNARYYRNVIGRFTTSDPAHANASLARPQSWNAYAYTSNNPLLGAIGRAAPIVSGVMAAIDVAAISYCTYKAMQPAKK